jgi:hypothetical protein
MPQRDRLEADLLAALEAGEDLLACLRKGREHIRECRECRDRIAAFAGEILTPDEMAFLKLVHLEDRGALREPVAYPHFAFPGPSRRLWETARGAPGAVRQLSDQVKLQVKLSRKTMRVSFGKLPDWLSSSATLVFAPSLAAAREGEKPKRTPVITLPDRESNLEIRVIIQPAGQGRGNLGVEVRQIAPDQPVTGAQVILRDEHGMEETRTRNGKAVFLDLAPGEYGIEVRPAQARATGGKWQLTLQIDASS